MSRVRSVLVALIVALATLLTWEVGAAIQHHANPPPQTAAGVVR